jgi:hypothetical protein
LLLRNLVHLGTTSYTFGVAMDLCGQNRNIEARNFGVDVPHHNKMFKQCLE